MTVSTTDNVVTYISGGPAFPIPYRFLQNSDIEAVLVKQDGSSETLMQGTQYALAGEGSQSGGTLTSAYAAGFLATPGASLTISRVMDAVQPTDLRNQGRYFAETHENVFDRLTMLIQQGFSILKRALLRPVGKNYYDAEGRRIANVADPSEQQDAVTKQHMEVYVGSLIGAGTGPINLASNVLYIDPNGITRTVQGMSGSGSATSGAGLIGYGDANAYAPNTVGGKVKSLQAVVESPSSSDLLVHSQLGQFAGSTIGRAIREANYERYSTLNEINSWLANSGAIKGHKVNILGDSIAFGAGAGTTFGNSIPENAWVRILGNALNEKYGIFSYGFVTPYTTNGTGTEIHTVSMTGTWTELFDAAAGHTPAGYARESTQANATLGFNQSVESSHFKIWYDGSVTGSFEISINGGATIVDTITTTGIGVGLEVSSTYACSPLAAGNTNYRVRVISGTVRITGISYLNDSTGLEFQLNNFSRDGRAGRYVAENVIKEMCRGCRALIWALAANDRSASGAALLDYKQRIDWLIQYANQYGTRLIIPDFLFINADNNAIRQELMRLALNVPNSTYIPFPNMLHINGTVQPAAYITTTINFTYDDVHLSQSIGHRTVAAAIGETLGVKASKLDNVTNNARWRPLNLSAASNQTLTYAGISKYRFYAKGMDLLLNINPVVSGTLVATVPGIPGNLLGRQYRSMPDATGKTMLVNISASGAITVFTDAGSSGVPTVVSLQVRVPLVRVAGFA
ncbi:hypothetical protein [Pseudomonas sp. NUPR-001]|uniref:hypothetical protein n=1 Tax=Pseudomonas sp. NUPR-001 TaxID=3416058 RepID=UPI003F9C75B2